MIALLKPTAGERLQMTRTKSMTAMSLSLFTAMGMAAGASAAATVPTTAQACTGLSDLYLASAAQLQACGYARVALSSTTTMSDGGTSLNYAQPDGETYSVLQPPASFNPQTASAAEDEAYGLPPAPPTSSPGYASWLTMARGSWASATNQPALIVSAAPITQPQGNASASLDVTGNPNVWAGYTQAGNGWTENEVTYSEPTLGSTSCSNPEVSFWAGIGNKPTALAQDGTYSGYGAPGLHSVWYEALPAGAAFPGPTASSGNYVIANVQYQGSGNYAYNINVAGVNHPYAAHNAGYDGSVVEAIVERPTVNNVQVPLLNFKNISIEAYDGRSLGAMSPTKEWDMTGYATTGAFSLAQFTVTQNHCNG
jgi:hypothetical protein